MPRNFCLVLITLAACGQGESPLETAIVSPIRAPCIGLGPQLCLTMVPDGQPEQRLFEGIEGYTHRWGVESEIEFQRETIENPPADSSSQRLILVDTIVENDIPLASFSLDFPGGPDWFSGTGTQLDLFGTTIQCDQAVCDQLRAADVSGAPFSATLAVVDAQTLRATAVVGP